MKSLVLSWRPELCQFSLGKRDFNSEPLELWISIYICLSAVPLCYTCFDCGRTYPDLIDPVPGLALHYLCMDWILS